MGRGGVLGVPNSSQRAGKSQTPIGGRGRYITFAVSGVPNSLDQGGKSEVTHWCAEWLHNPCSLGDSLLFRAGRNINSDPMVGEVATILLPYGGPQLFTAERKIRRCPLGGRVPT